MGEYLLSWDGAICPSTLMLSRRLALRVPFNPGYRTMEDWDLFLRLDSLGVDWCYIDRPLTLYDWSRNRPRLSGSATPSEHLAWLEDHRNLLTDQAIRRFTMGPLMRSITQTGQNRWYGLKTLGSALKDGAISRQEASHQLVRIPFLKSLGRLRR
ncbi:glycosyltransferase family protein [Thiocapsa bogorovii]|uniref:hypothetical protein n=1 Tax=Thiocapsa bogorovii TaxID=521689 RepID=UPI001E34F597|nr:hypothetical protein [Thiocapsa bogorovii]UHD15894.1 hypothetical protein LT988_21990 [Thiocapsa bogorovii]